MRQRRREVWAKWTELVAEQGASGLGVTAFCRERGVPAAQLFAWRKRLRQAAAEQFVEVQVAGDASDCVLTRPRARHAGTERPAGPGRTRARAEDAAIAPRSRAIEIRLRERRIFVEPGFDADHLRAIVATLESLD